MLSHDRGRTYRAFFKSNFAQVGDDAMLVKESQCLYRMNASGRMNCIALQAILNVGFFFLSLQNIVLFSSFFA